MKVKLMAVEMCTELAYTCAREGSVGIVGRSR